MRHRHLDGVSQMSFGSPIFCTRLRTIHLVIFVTLAIPGGSSDSQKSSHTGAVESGYGPAYSHRTGGAA